MTTEILPQATIQQYNEAAAMLTVIAPFTNKCVKFARDHKVTMRQAFLSYAMFVDNCLAKLETMLENFDCRGYTPPEEAGVGNQSLYRIIASRLAMCPTNAEENKAIAAWAKTHNVSLPAPALIPANLIPAR